jgi:hypothetical protein
VRHLPVPARELEILGKQVYTYGGYGQAAMVVTGTPSNPSCPPQSR